jgi:outer membrane protein TolC
MTFETAKQRALENSDELAILRATQELAEQRVRAVGQIPEPEWRQLVSEDRLRYGLRMFCPNPWVRSRQTTAERARVEALGAEIQGIRQQMIHQLRRLFAERGFLWHDMRQVNELVDLQRGIMDAEKAKLKQGAGTIQGLMTVSSRYLGMQEEYDQVLAQYERSGRLIAEMLALSAEEIGVLAEVKLPDLKRLLAMPEGALEEHALRNRADLQEFFWKRAAAEADWRADLAGRRPWVKHVQVTYSDEIDDSDEWRLEFALPLPFFGWKGQRTRVSQAEFRQAELSESLAETRIRTQVREAVLAVRRCEKRRNRSRQQTEPVLEQMRQMLQQVDAGSGLMPEQKLEMKVQLLKAERARRRNDYEVSLVSMRLLEVLGEIE